MKDYRVKVTIRNARILSAIEDAGYRSVLDFANKNAISYTAISQLTSLRQSPVKDDGRLRDSAQELCDVLCLLPEDLWTDDQLYLNLPRNTYEYEISAEDAAQIAFDAPIKIQKLLESSGLNLREEKVLAMRFGDTPSTYEEIGKQLDVTRERIRQIEHNAIRKMRSGAHKLDRDEIMNMSEFRQEL
jgi:RNA polymerase sigma factor (sigma-70 family)